MVNMGKLSATICVPFGAETMENDPCTVGTTRNYTAIKRRLKNEILHPPRLLLITQKRYSSPSTRTHPCAGTKWVNSSVLSSRVPDTAGCCKSGVAYAALVLAIAIIRTTSIANE